MMTRTPVRKSTAVAALLLAAGLAAAAPTLSTEYRYASQLNEYFVRGDAAVSESTVLKRGLRLAAWDAQNEQEASRVAVASAVYFFQVPAAARAVAIEVAYRPDEAAQDKQVAGFLFVRDKAIEDQFAEQNKDDKRPVEEPGFFGNTYFLPAKEPRVTITLPTENHVIDGVLEVHLSAGAGQVFDAQYVQVTALGAEVAPRIEEVAAQNYVADPYQQTYYYYYAGPCYYPYPTYYACFYITSFDPIFWHQWYLRRAHYHHHHRWCHRPHFYTHHPLIAISRPFYIFRPYILTYRDNWYRRSFHVDPDRWSRDDLQRLVRHRSLLLSPDEVRQRDTIVRRFVSDGREAERQLRQTLGDRVYEAGRDPRRVDPQAVRALESLRRDNINSLSEAWASLHAARWQPDNRRPPAKPDRPPTPVKVGRDRPVPTTIQPVTPTQPLPPTKPVPKGLPTRPIIVEDQPPRRSDNDGFPGSHRKPGVVRPSAPTPVLEPPQDSGSKSRRLMERFQEVLGGSSTRPQRSGTDTSPRRRPADSTTGPAKPPDDTKKPERPSKPGRTSFTPVEPRVIETPPPVKTTPLPRVESTTPPPVVRERPTPRNDSPTPPPPVVRERPTPPSPPPPRSDDTPRVRRDSSPPPPPSKDESGSSSRSSDDDRGSHRGGRR